MSTEFEWPDFALQAPSATAESLDAAGIGSRVPERLPEPGVR